MISFLYRPAFYIVRGAVVGSGANIAFVPDVGSSLRIHLESEACVCSFSSEFLFIFEILNLYVFSMYALFLPFCSSRSAPPFPLVPGLAPESLLAAIFRGRARRARPLLLLYVLLLLLLLLLFFSSNGSLWQPYEGNIGK